MKTIYFDMDGVLVDFIARVEEITGKTIAELNSNSKDVIREIMDEHCVHHDFFFTMPPMSDFESMYALMRVLKSMGYGVEILSTVTPADYNDKIIDQKTRWLEVRFLGDIKRNFVERNADKAEYADEDSILIDDRSHIVKKFIKKGGIGIHHRSYAETLEELISHL